MPSFYLGQDGKYVDDVSTKAPQKEGISSGLLEGGEWRVKSGILGKELIGFGREEEDGGGV